MSFKAQKRKQGIKKGAGHGTRHTIIVMIEGRGRLHEKGQCIHHWMIDENDVGTCKKCGEVRDFRALLAKERHKKIPFGGITELLPEVNDRP